MTGSTTSGAMNIRNKINWKSYEERLTFETDLENYRKKLKERSVLEKILWVIGIFVLPCLMVISLYGPAAYLIVSISSDRQQKEEQILLEKCNNRSFSTDRAEEICDITNLEYFDLENYILIKLYPYLALFCQGTAFLAVCSWHFTNYRWWNICGTWLHCICLPVDILIFYVEPFGFVGTSVMLVLGFVPFYIVCADAAFPIKPMTLLANGRLVTKNRNSWTEDFSISYNQRYNFVARLTWIGWSAFASLALAIALMKGSSYNEVALGIVVLTLEGAPGVTRVALTVINWDSPYIADGFQVFESLIDIPLVLWYLTFYSSPRTTTAVIGKLVLNYIGIFVHNYANYAERYLYNENYDTKETEENFAEIRSSNRFMFKYDNSKLFNVVIHHILLIASCPFIVIWEIFSVMKEAFIRDLK